MSGGLKQLVDQTFLAKVESGNIRQVVYPAANARTAAVSDGSAAAGAWSAYVQICAADAITDPSWLLGISLDTTVVEAVPEIDFAIASGAAGSEVDLAVFPASLGYSGTPVEQNLEPVGQIIPALYPIKITGAPRLAVRVRKDTGTSAAGCSLALVLGEDIGT